jgi:PAS domain S-box-containing protein
MATGDHRERTRDVAQTADETEKYRLFADAAEEGVVIHDYHRMLAANAQFARMFGYSEDSVLDVHPFGFIASQERAGIEAIAHCNHETSGETLGIRADGSAFPIQIIARPVTYQGQDARIVRVRDVTEYRRAQASLDASEERFRATFEQAAVGIAHVALDGSFIRVNRRLCEITGYDHDELSRRTFQDITHPDDLNADLERLHALVAGKLDRYSMEKRYFRKDGAIVWINLTVAMVEEAGGQPAYFISVIEDVSVRKDMEETLRRSQKMDVVGQLTSSIAHDFGNFLNIIKGNLQLIQISNKDEKSHSYIESALAGADLAETLIRQLLSFSRRQEPEVEAADINALIDNVLGLLQKAVTEAIPLSVALDEGLCIAVCDPGQLETALLNMALNARDAVAGSAGAIAITTSRVSAPQKPGHLEGAFVRIDVSDNGHGMPPDVVAHACDPFFTTKARGSGTGLGLSQVARCVAQANGFLDIESTEGVGTTISLFFPAVPSV